MQICIDLLLLLLDFRFFFSLLLVAFFNVCRFFFWVERMGGCFDVCECECVCVIRQVAYHMVCLKSAAAVAADGDGDACTVCMILFFCLFCYSFISNYYVLLCFFFLLRMNVFVYLYAVYFLSCKVLNISNNSHY